MTLKEMFLNYLRATSYYFCFPDNEEVIMINEGSKVFIISFHNITDYDLSLNDNTFNTKYAMLLSNFHAKFQQNKRFEKKFPEKGKSKVIKI